MTALLRRIAPPTDWGLRRIEPAASGDAVVVEENTSASPDEVLLHPYRSTDLHEVLRTSTPVHPYRSTDLATGRGLTYEWENFMADVLDRLVNVEVGIAPGVSYVHGQPTPAATWQIQHNLGTKPVIAVVSVDGDLLFAEVSYPDDESSVITFGQPYAGTAYLRG